MSASSGSSEPSPTGTPHLSTVRVRYDACTEATTYAPVVPHGDSVLWTAELPVELLGGAEFSCLEFSLESDAGSDGWTARYGEVGEEHKESQGVTVAVKWHKPTSVSVLVRNDNQLKVELILHIRPVFKVGEKCVTAPDPQIVLPPEKKPG